jgi:hypothetical protein
MSARTAAAAERPAAEAGETSWTLLPDFLLRSTGFGFEWLDELRLTRSAACAEELVERAARVTALQEHFDAGLFERWLDGEQARSSGADAFRPWYEANRCVRRGRPWPPGLSALLGARESQAGSWGERWSDALAARDAAHGRLTASFDGELAAARSRLHAIATDERFREAVLLSSPEVYAIGLASYERRFDVHARPSKVRYLEGRLYAYVQRFCTKNDTTSFFGPIDYGRVDGDRAEAFAIRRTPGGPPARRLTRLSWWAADALAETVSADDAVRPHLVARLATGCELLASNRLAVPGREPVALAAADAALLAAVDGARTVNEVCHAAGGARARLERFVRAGIVNARIELPTSTFDPLLSLRAAVAALPPPAGGTWLALLDELAADLEDFAGAAAPTKLALLQRVEERFASTTGQPARRGHGQTYADRLVLYDEAQGDVADCVVGAPMRDELVRRLRPALDLCAWYSSLVQRACQRRARDLLRERHGDAPQPYLTFVAELERVAAVADVLAEPAIEAFRARLHVIARAAERDGRVRLRAGDLRELAVDVPAGTLVSPDIFVAASDPEAIARGDYEIVIGELHYGAQVCCHFLTFHPERDAVAARLRDALPETAPGELRAGFVHGRSQGKTFYLEPPGVAVELRGRSQKPRGEVVAISDVEIHPVGDGVELRSRSRDAVLRSHPGDPRAVANWIFGTPPVVAPDIVLGSFTPRVDIDGTVLTRARWELDAAELCGVLAGRRNADLMTAAQVVRAEHGLPERCFVRVASERKPFFVDLANLFALEQLVTLVSGGGKVVLSEVLPRPEQWWLRGPGTRSNEWRMTLVAGGQGG